PRQGCQHRGAPPPRPTPAAPRHPPASWGRCLCGRPHRVDGAVDGSADAGGRSDVTSEAHRLWEMCATLLRAQVSEPVWHTAFEGVRAISFDGRTLTLGVTSPLAKERIEGRYLPLVRDALSEAGAPDVQLELRLEPMEPPTLWTVPTPQPAPAAGAGHAYATTGVPPSATPRAGNGSGTATGDVELNPRYTFENFVIGGSNRFAHAAAQSVAEMPAR